MRLAVRRLLVGVARRRDELAHAVALHEGDHTAAESGARLPRADGARRGQHGRHHRLHGRDADRVEIARARERRRRQRPDRRPVARRQRAGEVQHALVFLDDEARPAPHHVRQIARVGVELRQGGIAQRPDLRVVPGQDGRAFLTLGAPLGVFGPAQLALEARIADHDLDAGIDRGGLPGQVAAVEQHRAPCLPVDRRVLVQNPAVDADELVFGPLA